MFQRKEQGKAPKEELTLVDLGNIPDKKFKVVIVKMLKEFGIRLDEQIEKLEVINKELENIKKNQTETNNTITEIKHTPEEINRPDDAEEQISKLEEKVVEITQAEQKKKKKKLKDEDIGGRLRWQNRRMLNTPRSMNTSKIHLHVEQLLLKTT